MPLEEFIERRLRVERKISISYVVFTTLIILSIVLGIRAIPVIQMWIDINHDGVLIKKLALMASICFLIIFVLLVTLLLIMVCKLQKSFG